MRYSMHFAQDFVTSQLLSLFSLSATTAYVDLTDDALIIKLGSLFEETFPLDNLGRASLTHWEWYQGLGLRTDFQGTVAPVTSFEKVVSIPLIKEQSLFLPLLGMLGVKVPCRRLVVSLANPDTFMVTFNAGKVDPTRPSSIKID